MTWSRHDLSSCYLCFLKYQGLLVFFNSPQQFRLFLYLPSSPIILPYKALPFRLYTPPNRFFGVLNLRLFSRYIPTKETIQIVYRVYIIWIWTLTLFSDNDCVTISLEGCIAVYSYLEPSNLFSPIRFSMFSLAFWYHTVK